MPRFRMDKGDSLLISSSYKKTCPWEGFKIPKIVLSSVDFPAPFAPSIETIFSASTRIDIPFNTSISPYPEWTFRSSTMGWLSAKICLPDFRICLDLFRRAFGDLHTIIQDDDPLRDIHHHTHVVLYNKKRL